MLILLRWALSAVSLIGVAYFLPGITLESFYIALIVALIVAVLNIFLKPILVILTLPINILTLGLFTLVINGFIFWFVASFIEGFEVVSFSWAIIGALVYSVLSYAINALFDSD